MLQVRTGNSINPDAAAAGKEIAAQVKENLSDMKMAFVYSMTRKNCLMQSRKNFREFLS